MGSAQEKIEKEFEAILDDLFEVGLNEALKRRSIAPVTFQRYLTLNQDRWNSYAHAREFKADLLVDEMIKLADGEDALVARNQIDIRKWIASKWQPKVYADRIDVNITETVDIRGALTEARQRVKVIDVTVHGEKEVKAIASEHAVVETTEQSDTKQYPD